MGGLIAAATVLVVAIVLGTQLENKKQAYREGGQDTLSFNQDLERVKRENRALEGEVKRLKEATNRLERERGGLVSERNQLNVKISALQAERLSIAALRADLEEAAEENNKRAEDNQKLRNQIKRLERGTSEQTVAASETQPQSGGSRLPTNPPALPVERTQTTAQPLETYKDWGLRCLGQESGGQGQCYIYQNLIHPEHGRLLGLTIGYNRQGSGLRAVITVSLAVGSKLQRGLKLQIDSKQESREELQFDRCSAQGCYTRTELGKEAIKQLKAGAQLFVTVHDSADKPFNFKVSLLGFTKAFDSLESRRAANQG